MGSIFDEEFNSVPRGGSWHDVAQICMNGHVVNMSSKASPDFNRNFCEKCGAPTITQCPNCKGNILGDYHVPDVVVLGAVEDKAPAFCGGCGKPFPWTESRVQAARDLLEELDGLSTDEKLLLSKSFDDLVTDCAQTQVAITRFKKLGAKLGKEAGGALKSILIDIVSEAAKKSLWPQ